MTEIILTKSALARFQHKHLKPAMCHRCLCQLNIGEKVERSKTSGKSKYYHCNCFESMLI